MRELYAIEGGRWPFRRGAPRDPPGEPADRGNARAVAVHQAPAHQPEDQACRGDPLRAVALAGSVLFLDDGRIEIDNNVVERTIRPLAVTRKNTLFAGSDSGAEHWAIVASLVDDRQAERRRDLGLAHRRARVHGLGPDQSP